jgi:glycosyltransferase involved in cell wall biosynthesis
LLNRYTDWGIAKEKILYLDNGQSFISEASSQNFSSEEVKICFSYFGQISTYKGIIVLLAAIEKLPKKMRETIRLDIHGANLELQPKAFQDKVFQILDKTKDCVQFLGPYRPDELPKLMAKVDWVIVPSIWWENAPLVIEEAFIHKRPVICSNIGGMAEKVEHEKSGLHFQVGDATDLAACIIRAATEEGLWDKLSNGISDRLTIKEMTDRTLDIYRQFQADRFKKSGL